MAKDKTLEVILEIRDKFSKVLDKFESQSKSSVGKVSSVVTAASTAFMALTKGIELAGRAFRGIVSIGQRVASEFMATAESLDRIVKVSQRIGLVPQALRELRFAAQQSGVDARTLDMALQRMTRRIGELAKMGRGEAKPALEALGLTVRDFIGLRPDEQFEKVADALASVEDRSERLSLAFKFFDSEGTAVLQMMQRGSAGVRDLREEYRRLAGVFTEEDFGRVTEFNDALNKIATAFRSIKERIVVETAPALSDFAGKFTDFILAAKNNFTAALDVLFRGSVDLFAAIGVSTGEIFMAGMVRGLKAAAPSLAKAFFDIYASIMQLVANAGIPGISGAAGKAAKGLPLLGQAAAAYLDASIAPTMAGDKSVFIATERGLIRVKNALVSLGAEFDAFSRKYSKPAFIGPFQLYGPSMPEYAGPPAPGGDVAGEPSSGGTGGTGQAKMVNAYRQTSSILKDISQGAASTMASVFNVSFFDPMTKRFRELQDFGMSAIQSLLSGLGNLMSQLGFRILSSAFSSALFGPTHGQTEWANTQKTRGSLGLPTSGYTGGGPSYFVNPGGGSMGGGPPVVVNYTINAADARGVKRAMEQERSRIINLARSDGGVRSAIKNAAMGR